MATYRDRPVAITRSLLDQGYPQTPGSPGSSTRRRGRYHPGRRPVVTARTDNAALVERLLDLWRRTPADDAEAVAAFAEVYADPLTVNGAPMTVAGLVARARTLHTAYSDLDLELLDVVTAPDRVVIAFVMRARHTGLLTTQLGSVPATGRTIAARTIDVLTVRDGLVSAIIVVADELGVLNQLDAVRLAGT